MYFETMGDRPGRLVFQLTLTTLLALTMTVEGMADELYAVGDTISPIELTDQHGKTGDVDRATRFVLLVRDKFASEILKEAFAGMPPSTLGERGVAYVTDISEIPLMAANLFVVPGMRLKEYSILIDRDPIKTSRFPSKGGLVTVLFIEDLRIARIEFATTGSEINALLHLPSGTPDVEISASGR